MEHKYVANKEIDKIKKEIEKEFPHDEALQQVHIARKILSQEAKEKGMGFFEYMRSIEKDLIKSSLADSKAGRTTDVEEIRRKYRL